MKRIFKVKVFRNEHEIGTITVEIDQAAIDIVDDAWRKDFYPLFSPETIVEHIAYSLFVYKRRLAHIDGWASLPDDFAKIIKDLNIYDDWQFSAEEENV